jgi:hypothetical protein
LIDEEYFLTKRKIWSFWWIINRKSKCIKKHAKLSKDFYSKCYLVAAHILNRTSSSTLNWNSTLIFMQKLLKEFIRNEIIYFKMFDCKTFWFLKKTNALKKSEKMKFKAFIECMIKYDFINIFRVWNSKKDDVNDYRDVIFNETKFFDTYKTSDLFKKEEKKSYLTYRAISLQIFENSDKKQYDKILIQKHVLNNSRKNVVSKSIIKIKISLLIETFRLSTFNNTSSFKSTSINIFVAVEISRFLFRKATSNKEIINFFRKNQLLNKENNIFFQKKNSFCSNSSKLLNEFFETKNSSLNVLTSRNINFRINEINIIHEKKNRIFWKNFANIICINEKMTKIFVFHTTMMIVFNTKTSKFEIKTTSSFKFHINNLLKSSLH